jgi:hemerythrin-like domain-containing protein
MSTRAAGRIPAARTRIGPDRTRYAPGTAEGNSAMAATSLIDFRTPAAGFDQPLEMWHACHERVARMNNLMERLVQHIQRNGVDKYAGVTAASVRRYFDEAAPRHHEDEEIDLFPRLMARLDAQPSGLAADRVGAAIQALLADHREMDQLWAVLRAQLLKVEAGADPHFDHAQVTLFITRYRAHIEIEEGQIAPALRRLLRAKDLREIGRAMAARRGVNWDEISSGTETR